MVPVYIDDEDERVTPIGVFNIRLEQFLVVRINAGKIHKYYWQFSFQLNVSQYYQKFAFQMNIWSLSFNWTFGVCLSTEYWEFAFHTEYYEFAFQQNIGILPFT